VNSPFSLPAVLQRSAQFLALAAFTAFATSVATAAPFEVAVSPSRFELAARNTQRVGQSVEIHNLGGQASEMSVRTIDWSYSESGNITYHDDLQPGSCRPWVTLQRRTVKVPARSKANFRFQVDVPLDAVKTECRFMIAIEGIEPAHKAFIEGGGASLSLPVSGRIAVAVYMSINGAAPKLEMKQVGVVEINKVRTLVVTVTNTGDAHGRLEGAIEATDAKGQSFELAPEGTPILPGQTRVLPLLARVPGNPAATVQPELPIKAKGTIDWEQGGFKVEAEFK
jgi:fimbrial chaperone protein